MDLSIYEALTGMTVEADQETFVKAQIKRTQKILESLLGFTLDPLKNTNLYNEIGKTSLECSCPETNSELLESGNLLPPDPVIGAYRLYTYNPNDKYFHIDPFTQVFQVKLVWNGITVKTFDDDDYLPIFKNGWGKFIENCQCNICDCCKCTDCIQLAVDADWLFNCDDSSVGDSSVGDSSVGSCIDDELLYIWADMITYYLDCKKDVKSELVLGHSYTKYDKVLPQDLDYNLAVLRKYAGPFGSLTKVIVP
jgi:hypothetical protein